MTDTYRIYEDDIRETAVPVHDSDGAVELVWNDPTYPGEWAGRHAPYGSEWGELRQLTRAGPTDFDTWSPANLILLHFDIPLAEAPPPSRLYRMSPDELRGLSSARRSLLPWDVGTDGSLSARIRGTSQAAAPPSLAHPGQLRDVKDPPTQTAMPAKFRGAQLNHTVATGARIFIGHGRSFAWCELKDFLSDRLKLPWDEFNREATAGLSTKERLQSMLDEATLAFLVMTGEDERSDGAKAARANVIHEVGLFQGRLGFERAIVLLEDGCEEFSNIVGLSQIRFPRNNITSAFEEIRRVLERERIIAG